MSISYRKATHEDNFNTFGVFLKSIMDYSERAGVTAITGGLEPEKLNKLWDRRRLLWEHLSNTCDQYWLAENDTREVIGYARSIVRGDHRELTEFFVVPGQQSAGIGKELIVRAFPNDMPHRSIIATTDFRALARYLKSGVYPYATEIYFERDPEPVQFESDLEIVPLLVVAAGEAGGSVLEVGGGDGESSSSLCCCCCCCCCCHCMF
jgi:hypothetical protein